MIRNLPLLIGAFGALHAATPQYEKDVHPVLARHCLSCHGDTVKMGDLDLRTRDAMLKGGTKGAALAPGAPERSLLLQRITEKSMPPGPKKLSESDVAVLREWIQAGAEAKPIAAAAAAKHWAFQPPRRPAIPRVRNQQWVRTPVDAFIMAALEAKGLQPAPLADRLTRLRRVYLSAIGLPPSLAEQEAFLKEGSYSQVVESLLSRPQYGERWARHWLDVVRYAESNGYERDGTKPNAWRYRDYVINAFNQNKPFDRFVIEQLAGDEIEGSNAETQIATTFLRLGTWDDEPAEPTQDRFDQLDDVLATTSMTFLGLTLRCARCHDHKFEPLTQKDYYRVLAVFTPLKRPQNDRTDLDRLAGTEEEVRTYTRDKEQADSAVKELERRIEQNRRAILKRLFADPEKRKGNPDLNFLDHAETVLAFTTEANRRSKEQKALVAKFNERLDRTVLAEGTAEERMVLTGSRKQIAAINAARLPEPPRAYVWYEDSPQALPTRLLVRGDPSRPGDDVEPGVPAVLAWAPPGIPAATAKTSGRRLWLAKWLTQPDHPLLARVIVNRIWQWHFGEGLVPTENDFGVAGQRPVHPELLDYLATELVQSGWNIKHIQRLILNSAAFQSSAAWNEKLGAADPDNTLLGRWKPRRLESEVVRDSMLSVAGKLSLDMAGPSIYPALPRAVLEGQSRPGDGWGTSDDRQASRRSVYIFVKRSLAVPELEALDSPDTTSSCEQRPVSTTGPQALTFLNGDFTHAQARNLASRVVEEAGPQAEAQVDRAYRLVLNRPHRDPERRAAIEFLASNQKQVLADSSQLSEAEARRKALEALCLVLLNSNEFFYLN